MHIVVVGSGGVGGFFGAKLAKSGQRVTFVARGAHLAAMRKDGLRIRSAPEGDWTVAAPAVETLDGQDPADLVLFCVKSFDTLSAAELVQPVLASHTAVLSLQNGIDNEDKLTRVLGPGHVLGGVAYVFANIEAPGVIAHHQLGRIVFGELSAPGSDRASAILDVLTGASIQAELSPDIRKRLWDKYVFQTAQGGTTAVTRLPTKLIREVPETRLLWQRQVEELLAIAEAENVGFDSGALTRYNQFLDSLAPANTSSLYQDLANGRRLELDAFHGEALRLGAAHGIPTPTLFAVDAALRPFVAGAPALN